MLSYGLCQKLIVHNYEIYNNFQCYGVVISYGRWGCKSREGHTFEFAKLHCKPLEGAVQDLVASPEAISLNVCREGSHNLNMHNCQFLH